MYICVLPTIEEKMKSRIKLILKYSPFIGIFSIICTYILLNQNRFILFSSGNHSISNDAAGTGMVSGYNFFASLIFVVIPYAIVVLKALYNFMNNISYYENKYVWGIVFTLPTILCFITYLVKFIIMLIN